MSEPYEEQVDGACLLRLAPDARHEEICNRLHALIRESLQGIATSRLLPCRSAIRFSPQTSVRPDLAVVASANGRLWLAAEVVAPGDHHADTVVKKLAYEAARIPRLWFVDPRYDNVEIYHGHPHGLLLKGMFAGQQQLTEALLPSLRLTVTQLFGGLQPGR